MTGEPYYVTTPIYYVNDAPHIGHAYTTVACDVLARFMRLDGRRVMFLTGTDEHGQKVEKSARAAGVDPQAFCDRVSQNFRDLSELMNISNDDFIRTTEPRHIEASQAMWRAIAANKSPKGSDNIYLGKYAGWYAVRDEAFYGEDELTTGPDGKKRAPSGAEVEWVEEPSYFFRLSDWQDWLFDCYERNPDFIAPDGAAQRGHELRQGRPARSLDLAHQLHLGRAGAGRSQARHVCLARRAHQLHHRGRLSRYGERGVQDLLARRPAHGRQGHPALPRRLLAGLPDGGRAGTAQARLRPWLVDHRRPEDLEVARQRHSPQKLVERIRPRCRALFPAARAALRQRRRFLAPRDGRAASTATSPTTSAIWRSAC